MEFEMTDYFKSYFGDLGEILTKIRKYLNKMISGDGLTSQQRKHILIIGGIVLLGAIVVCTVWGFITMVKDSHVDVYDRNVSHARLGLPEFMKGGARKLWKAVLIFFLLGTAVCEWFYLRTKYDMGLHNALGVSLLFAVLRTALGFAAMFLAGFVLYLLICIILNVPASILETVLFGIRGIFSKKGFDKQVYNNCNTKVFNMLGVISGTISILCGIAMYVIINIVPLVLYVKNNK